MPRHAPPRPGVPAGRYSAWLTVGLQVRVSVPEWRHADALWVHWAAPLARDGTLAAPLRELDPGGRAMAMGEPPGLAGPCDLSPEAARLAIEGALSAWAPELSHQPDLDLVSRLDEERGAFRRRCLEPLRSPSIRGAGAPRDAAAAAARVAGRIEHRRLGPGEVEVTLARYGVVWYAFGDEPAPRGGDPMIAGAARERR